MSNNCEGCRISNRLNLWYGDDMQHWTLSGKEETFAATGMAGEMVEFIISQMLV